MNKLFFFISVLCFMSFWACDLEQEIEIDLSDYEPQLVVECYLQTGKPFSLLLTESAPYFEQFPSETNDFINQLLVDSAQVVISHKGTEYILENGLFFDFEDQKFFNYQNQSFVPEDYDSAFELYILSKDGREIEATTRLLPKVPIDSIVVEFSEETVDSLARVLTYFTDDPNTQNFYRRMLNEVSLDSLALQDFTIDDRLYDGPVVFGSGFIFAPGDTVYNTLFHITEDYYNFLESVQNASSANINPFGQPSPINSNIKGNTRAIGIFTGLSYERIQTIIPE